MKGSVIKNPSRVVLNHLVTLVQGGLPFLNQGFKDSKLKEIEGFSTRKVKVKEERVEGDQRKVIGDNRGKPSD